MVVPDVMSLYQEFEQKLTKDEPISELLLWASENNLQVIISNRLSSEAVCVAISDRGEGGVSHTFNLGYGRRRNSQK
jgi:hypothetical protein